MLQKMMKFAPCFALCVLLLVCISACGTGETSAASASAAPAASASAAESAAPAESASESAASSAAADALADTTWTADVGEEYGAALQGDEEDAVTTLTLHFGEDGTATNVVGDVCFHYVLNDDGTVTVSDLEVGDTAISTEVFELTYADGALTLHTRINGGNADLTFEQE